jgi:hypothetical protein
MCAKLKAENYAMMVDEGTLACMDNLYAYLPVFGDIYEFCYSSASSLLLGISLLLSMTLYL